MTADEFCAWLGTMQVTGAEAAALLSVKPNTVTRYRRKGGPKMLGLACATLLEQRKPELKKADDLARKEAAHLASVTENSDFSMATVELGWSRATPQLILLFDTEEHSSGRLAIRFRTVAAYSGRLGKREKGVVRANGLSPLSIDECVAAASKWAHHPWAATFLRKHGLKATPQPPKAAKPPFPRADYTAARQDHALYLVDVEKLTRGRAAERLGVSATMVGYLIRQAEHKRDSWGLSARATNAIINMGAEGADAATAARSVARLTEAEVLRTPNLGRKTAREIETWLSQFGLRFGMGSL